MENVHGGMLMFKSNTLLLLYKSDMRELVYLTRFTMLSINISRKFPNLCAPMLFTLAADTSFIGLQTLKSVFRLFCICSAKSVPSNILAFCLLDLRVPCLK